MAEERTLGLARAAQRTEDAESKEELQRRMELARDSISHTVTEIKETVADRVQAVRDTLDWREQFRRRPLAWSAGSLGVGFIAGYSLGGAFKHESEHTQSYSIPTSYGFASQTGESSLGPVASSSTPTRITDEGPGLVERVKETSAYDALSKEVGSLGQKLVEELSSTAHLVVLPFVVSKLKEWTGLDRLEQSISRSGTATARRTEWTETNKGPKGESALGH